jgi:hypothetical protein
MKEYNKSMCYAIKKSLSPILKGIGNFLVFGENCVTAILEYNIVEKKLWFSF